MVTFLVPLRGWNKNCQQAFPTNSCHLYCYIIYAISPPPRRSMSSTVLCFHTWFINHSARSTLSTSIRASTRTWTGFSTFLCDHDFSISKAFCFGLGKRLSSRISSRYSNSSSSRIPSSCQSVGIFRDRASNTFRDSLPVKKVWNVVCWVEHYSDILSALASTWDHWGSLHTGMTQMKDISFSY